MILLSSATLVGNSHSALNAVKVGFTNWLLADVCSCHTDSKNLMLLDLSPRWWEEWTSSPDGLRLRSVGFAYVEPHSAAGIWTSIELWWQWNLGGSTLTLTLRVSYPIQYLFQGLIKFHILKKTCWNKLIVLDGREVLWNSSPSHFWLVQFLALLLSSSVPHVLIM